MADAHEDGIDSVLSSQHRSHRLPPVHQGGPAAPLVVGLPVIADEPALGTADRWYAGDDPDMAGDAEPAWMRESMSIAEYGVGPPA